MERDRRPSARGYDAIDQELGGRHVAVLRGGRQHRLEHGLDALRRERVKARPRRLGQGDVISLASRSAAAGRLGHNIRFDFVRHRLKIHKIQKVGVTNERVDESQESAAEVRIVGLSRWMCSPQSSSASLRFWSGSRQIMSAAVGEDDFLRTDNPMRAEADLQVRGPQAGSPATPAA